MAQWPAVSVAEATSEYFSECSKSSNLKHFTGIAQKVWQSDPTGVALALTLIESFVESKFGCP
jgi:hypothetical protein